MEKDVGLSNKRLFNKNLGVRLSLTALLQISYLAFLSLYTVSKCPSDSVKPVKPVNQLSFTRLELSNKLSAIPKEYLALIN